MKKIIFGISIIFITTGISYGQSPAANKPAPGKAEQELLDLSKAKWAWMAEKKVDTLKTFFDDKAMFVHMGGSWGKSQELEVIKSGMIWYKRAEVYSASVNIFENAAILLNEIDLVAVVGQNEVINPFMVTEVYIRESGKWKMGSLTFSKLSRPVKITGAAEAQKK